MIKGKYKQLFLPLQFGGIRTITIYNRCGQAKSKKLEIKGSIR